ncbi:condensation domain-containing protein [Streptomyces aureus]
MTETGGRLLPLNTAQARNMRNFIAEELPYWRLSVVAELAGRVKPSQAKTALTGIVARHEALRSRLAVGSSGRVMQEILPACEAEAVTRWHHVDETYFDSAEPRFWQEMEMDPWSHAFHATAYVVDGFVAAIKMTVSHMFTDRIGIQVIENELRAIGGGQTVPASDPQQASAYALTGMHPQVAQNTDLWRNALSVAPRSCTYVPVFRDQVETVYGVELQLPDDLLERVDRAASNLRTTPSCIWTAAVSVLAEGLTGQHRQVFKTTTANRVSPRDFTAVAQLAQVIFMPLLGASDDTLRVRVDLATEASFGMFEHGVYDANAVLDHFNTGSGFAGMPFLPAFEWHYIPTTHRLGFTTDTVPRTFEEQARIDLRSAQSDLQVSLSYEPDPVLQIRARRPISEERSPDSLMVDLLRTVELIHISPDTPVKSVGISMLSARASLATGHHSGAAPSLAFTEALILAVPGVVACDLCIDDTNGHLHAELKLGAGHDPTCVKDGIRSAVMRAHGAVLPDAYTFIFA